jgi:hypothetical protein
MKRDDSFVRQDFCGKEKKEICLNEEIHREDFLRNTRRFGPRNTRPSKKKNTKTKKPKITIFQPNS